MTTATLEATGHIDCVHLADGMLVRLGGTLSGSQLPELRDALLAPLDEGCRDVVVDAGEVDDVDDDAIAVLIAADEWASHAGARLLLSRTTPVVEQALADLGFGDRLQRLTPLSTVAARPVLVPAPRQNVD